MPTNNLNDDGVAEILEDVFSAGQVQMASIQTGKNLPKNYADNRINEAKAKLSQLIDYEVTKAFESGENSMWAKTYDFLNGQGDILEEWEAYMEALSPKDTNAK